MKLIAGYKTYLISEDGKIYSIKSRKLMKQFVVSYTHRVGLSKNGKIISQNVAKLVALTYIGKPKDKKLNRVIHIDGNKKNLHYSNLRWGTDGEAKSNLYKLGLKLSPFSKLNKTNVYFIRKTKMKNKDLAVKYGVSDVTIISIKKRRTWSSI